MDGTVKSSRPHPKPSADQQAVTWEKGGPAPNHASQGSLKKSDTLQAAQSLVVLKGKTKHCMCAVVHRSAPPSTEGKRASSTRCPVSRGVLASSFWATGRGDRTGHV